MYRFLKAVEGLVPIVHGQSLSWIVPQTVSKALGVEGLSCHRTLVPDWEERASRVRGMVKKQIAVNERSSDFAIYLRRKTGFFFKEKNFSNCSYIDHQEHIRPYLIAGTIGAFHNVLDESPFSFAFGNSVTIRASMGAGYIRREFPGNRSVLSEGGSWKIGNGIIEQNMKMSGCSETQIALLIGRLDAVYQKCRKVPIGQFLAIGVPEELLDEYVYSSIKGGIPTGRSVREDLHAKYPPQVRLILDGKTLAKDGLIKIVNIMNFQEVEDYCKDHVSDVLDIKEALQIVCEGKKETEIEETSLQEIEQIQKEVYDALAL